MDSQMSKFSISHMNVISSSVLNITKTKKNNNKYFIFSERKSMIPEIYENIHESIYELVKQMEILSLEYDNLTNINSAEFISSCGCNCPTNIDEVRFSKLQCYI